MGHSCACERVNQSLSTQALTLLTLVHSETKFLLSPQKLFFKTKFRFRSAKARASQNREACALRLRRYAESYRRTLATLFARHRAGCLSELRNRFGVTRRGGLAELSVGREGYPTLLWNVVGLRSVGECGQCLAIETGFKLIGFKLIRISGPHACLRELSR